MVWIAAVTAWVSLLVLWGVDVSATRGVALLAGAPVVLFSLWALTPPGQAIAIALLLAALYGWLARGIRQGSTVALGLGLVLLLIDLVGGVLAALGTSGETPAGLVIGVATVFFGPRLGLIYLIGQCLSQKKDNPIALKSGVLARELVWFLIDPIGWFLYLTDRSAPAIQGRADHRNRVAPNPKQLPEQADEKSGLD